MKKILIIGGHFGTENLFIQKVLELGSEVLHIATNEDEILHHIAHLQKEQIMFEPPKIELVKLLSFNEETILYEKKESKFIGKPKHNFKRR